MRHEILKVVALSSILLLLASCGGKEEAPEEAPVARPVKVMTVGGSVGGEFTFPGRVAAGQQVDLSFRVGGPLVEFPVQEGQAIQKGQIVAKVDPRDFRIRVESAQARFDRAEADIERLSALYEKDAASKAQLDQSRATRDVAKATLDDAEADLADTQLRAPFSANVGEIFVENFQEVQPKQPILSLVGLDTVEIQVDLPESVMARVRVQERSDGEVFARFGVAPDRKFPLELTEIATQADPRTQTYRATLVMPQPEGINILPGMTAEVVGSKQDNRDTQSSIVVPSVAVAGGDSGSAFVWVVDDETMTVHRREVTTGDLVGADQIRITDGIESGETIAVSAVSRLGEGMAIRKMGE